MEINKNKLGSPYRESSKPEWIISSNDLKAQYLSKVQTIVDDLAKKIYDNIKKEAEVGNTCCFINLEKYAKISWSNFDSEKSLMRKLLLEKFDNGYDISFGCAYINIYW